MNPDFISSAAHVNRFKEIAIQQKEWIASLTIPLPAFYTQQFQTFFQIAELAGYGVDHYTSAAFNNPFTREKHMFLRESVEERLNMLCETSQFQDSADTQTEALWLAKLFILSYDLSVILGIIPSNQASDMNIFPDRLIELLAEKHTEISEPNEPEESSPPPEISSKTDIVYSNILAPQHQNKLSIESKQIHKVDSKSKSDDFVQIDPRELLHVRKRKQVEKILEALGLRPIRQKGSHVMWEHPEHPELHATVPQKAELPSGTVRNIYKQATGGQMGF